MRKALTGCLPYGALALAAILVWPFVAGAIVVKLILTLWIMAFGSIALAKFRLGLEARGKYDLERLRAVHEREALRGIEVPAVADDADEKLCPHCGQGYNARFPNCPRCKV